MPKPGNTRFQPSRTDAEAQALDAARRSNDARRRRLEREVFESATRNLARPLLRPRTGTPLRPDLGQPADPHQPNTSGGPVVLPPATFTDDDLKDF
jgi:hypothetical protein